MLDVQDISVDIGGSRILQDISLRVNPGELVCLLGRNGAGKTTLLRSVMGYWRPTAGRIQYQGHAINSLPTHRIAKLGIGFSPEESEVFADLTVQKNIELPTWTRSTDRSADERIARAYQLFPKLPTYKHRQGDQLSGGERKMVSIARALTLDPGLLLLDEPFEGLSPAIVPAIAQGVASILELGRAVLIAESNFHHVPSYASRLYVIERGELLFEGSYADAKADAQVRTVVSGLA